MSCFDVELNDVKEDWWCSQECEESGGYIYCHCKKSTAENIDMVQCELAGDCMRDEWYHPSCLCVPASKLPRECRNCYQACSLACAAD